MRCLGIPNTAHFANITKIKDAIELWKKLKDAKEQEIFHPELEVTVCEWSKMCFVTVTIPF